MVAEILLILSLTDFSLPLYVIKNELAKHNVNDNLHDRNLRNLGLGDLPNAEGISIAGSVTSL